MKATTNKEAFHALYAACQRAWGSVSWKGYRMKNGTEYWVLSKVKN